MGGSNQKEGSMAWIAKEKVRDRDWDQGLTLVRNGARLDDCALAWLTAWVTAWQMTWYRTVSRVG